MPTISAVGKRRPTSTTRMRSSYSRTVMFLPISPSPPSGRTRSLPPATLCPGRREQAVALEHLVHLEGLVFGGLDERQAQPADPMAEHVERGLDGSRARGQEQRLVDVAQLGIDLAAAG